MTKPLVSIVSFSYNHEKYIKQALDGFIMQQTNFTFEIIVHDDASTDNTQEIIRKYEEKYSDLFRPIYQKENQKSKGNGIVTIIAFSAVRGKYIALCEGDDYWTDPYKLQKQVDFLEKNPEYGLISSDIVLINGEGEKIEDNNMVLSQRAKRKPDVDFFDLLQTNLINSPTVCVRADLVKDLTNRIINETLRFAYDYWFWMNIALKSKIHISYEKMAAYRIHQQGASRQKDFFKSIAPLAKYDAIVIFLTSNKSLNIKVPIKTVKYLFMNRNLRFQKRLKLVYHLFIYQLNRFFLKLSTH